MIPMAALDDMVGVAVFFTTIAVVARHISGNGMPLYMIPVMILLPLLNFMLMGMAFSTTFSNMVTEERLQRIIADFNPLLGVSMIVVILNLGAPLDYHAILGAGVYTVVYIIVRAAGKYFGARIGAKITGMP